MLQDSLAGLSPAQPPLMLPLKGSDSNNCVHESINMFQKMVREILVRERKAVVRIFGGRI